MPSQRRRFAFGERFVARDDRAAVAHREILYGVETEAGDIAERPAAFSPVKGARSVGGVFDDEYVGTDRLSEGVDIDGPAAVVNWDDGFCCRRDFALYVFDVDGERSFVNVGEDGDGVVVCDAVRGRDKGHRRDNDLVASADAEQPERQIERGRAGIDGDGIGGAEVFGELLFELRRARPQAYPAGADDFRDRVDFFVAHRRFENLYQRFHLKL